MNCSCLLFISFILSSLSCFAVAPTIRSQPQGDSTIPKETSTFLRAYQEHSVQKNSPEDEHLNKFILEIQRILPLPKRSVLDYYMAISEDYFQSECGEGISIVERSQRIIKKNISNGYILSSSGGELGLEIVLFRDRTNNRDIIAVNDFWVVGEYFCGHLGTLGLFELNENGIWVDVTKSLLNFEEIVSQVGTDNFVFRYPEKGTTVLLLDPQNNTNKETILGYLYWKNGKFEFRKQ